MVGDVRLPEGRDRLFPGDSAELAVTLGQPVPLEPGLGFAVREGGRTVAAGTVQEIHG